MQRQTTNLEKIFGNHLSNKELYPEYLKYSVKSTEKSKKSNLKMGKRQEQTFHQRVYRWQINPWKNVQLH